VKWATESCKFGWCVANVFPSGTDGTHINHMDRSSDDTLLATGDDYGLVNLFNFPCRNKAKCVSLRGHSEHVTKVRFTDDKSYLFSAGGYDQTILQWKFN
jgi:WD40 repeat protein